ncbi:MAG TPA: carboxypeptidase regulatory-like domain-containing protein [Candidatus Baltobacteraceae bacterium]|nr:carboxypeptidase regulatory-like domain-containing protein [Candidatus Baltobacteraceae bacterium]
MRFARAVLGILLVLSAAWMMAPESQGQAGGNSVNVGGTVTDPTGAVVPGATVTVHDPVSGFEASATTDASGDFTIPNVPFNPYHMTVTAKGFAEYVQDVDVRSAVPLALKISLQLAGTTQTVTVEGGNDLIENDSTAHTDIDRKLFNDLPLESQSSSLSSLVTLASPGIAADSNGLFHGLGDHAENSFSVDGQPITDQQSKVFSNQVPVDAVQSLEVIEGAPPAEYGDKTSVVIDVTTRSGQGMTTPHGAITADYGTFGTANGGFNLGYGGQNWGNFISVDGLNTSRFLDPPEFVVMHDKGNEENVFDRLDYQLTSIDSIHLDLGFSRSWFQTPNSYDAEDALPWNGLVVNNADIGPNGLPVGPTDQRSQILTYNIAPTWTRVINNNTVLNVGAWDRHDQYNYYPSDNPFADLGPPSLQRETVSQLRFLTNAGARATLSYVKGINNIKAGVSYEQTVLTENDKLGIVDPTLNAPCITANTTPNQYTIADAFVPVQGFTDPSQCGAYGYEENVASNPDAPNNAQFPVFNPVLLPYDLTRGGGLFATHELFPLHTDVKELALYVQDTVTKNNWTFNLGMRGDVYNGLSTGSQAEPRIGIAYNVKQTNTVLRVSYARTLETPFNENLVLSSIGCGNDVLSPLLLCSSSSFTPLQPGFRNEFHAGLEQAFGKHIVFDGEYIWKYTHNGYDFSVLGNTPITFPIEWNNSKIPGFAARVNLTNLHGFTADLVMSSVAARFFTPQIGGAGAVPVVSAPGEFTPFRIDHDERFNETTHLQYQPSLRWPWLGFNWRYDSGLVAGATPCFGYANNDCPGSITTPGGVNEVSMIASNVGGVPLSADQEFEAGFTCDGVHATPTTPLPYNCPASEFGSTLIKVPAPGTENDDHYPPRILPRNLFDLAVGDDNLFRGDRYKWSARITVINLANEYALYNFLSTFSGTHYVTPRTVTAEIGFHF